jgi:PiT family inorganic phosphate transporter
MSELALVILIIAVALTFDFINGFHDAANSVATVVATRVLTPLQAVVWAAFFNFISAFSFGTGVAKTVGAGMVDLSVVTPYVILGGLIGAIVWDLVTWWLGLPTSSSHALFGGYAGAAMARVTLLRGLGHATDALVWSGWVKTLIFMVLAPMIGLALAYIYMVAIYWLFRGYSPRKWTFTFRRLSVTFGCCLQLLPRHQ